MPPPQSQTELLKQYPRPIAHLRGQLKRQRLGLIFGAGVSLGIGFPNWQELVNRVAAHPDVGVQKNLERFRKKGSPAIGLTQSLASVTQMLFGEYRDRQIKESNLTPPLPFLKSNGFAPSGSSSYTTNSIVI